MQKVHSPYHELLDAIKKRYGKPVNVQVVCAALEAMGIREVDVPGDYGFSGIESFARHIYAQLLKSEESELKNENQIASEQKMEETFYLSAYGTVKTSLFIKDFSNGMFHLMPIVFQLLAIVVLGFSLWTYVGFNNLQATAVVLGLIVGLTATGGAVQGIGRQVAFYWYREDFAMSQKAIFQGTRNGLIFLLLSAGLLILLNGILNLYPLVFSLVVCMYALLIGSLLLIFAPLYTIKKRWIISAAVLAGTMVAIVLLLYTSMSIYVIHAMGIGTAIGVSCSYSYLFFRRKLKQKPARHYGAPKQVVGVYRNLNYFTYGTLFYVFIFTDRILAWSATGQRDIPFVIYYDKDYEIGMDLAMLVFFLLAGVLEYSLGSFSRNIERKQRTLLHREIQSFYTEMLHLYKKYIFLLVVNAGIAGVGLYYLMTRPWGYQAGFDETLAPLSLFVAAVGGVGYLFLTIGMLNVLLLHTLNQSGKPLASLFIAFGVNVAVGFVMGRVWSFEYSAFGLLAGAIVFMALTTKHTLQFIKNLDYHYYAAI